MVVGAVGDSVFGSEDVLAAPEPATGSLLVAFVSAAPPLGNSTLFSSGWMFNSGNLIKFILVSRKVVH